MDDFLDLVLDISPYLFFVFCLYYGVRFFLIIFAPTSRWNVHRLNQESERMYHKVVKKMKFLNEGGHHGKDWMEKSAFYDREKIWKTFWETERLRKIHIEGMETFKYQPEKRFQMAQDWNDYLWAAERSEDLRDGMMHGSISDEQFDEGSSCMERMEIIKKRMMNRLGIKELYPKKESKSED